VRVLSFSGTGRETVVSSTCLATIIVWCNDGEDVDDANYSPVLKVSDAVVNPVTSMPGASGPRTYVSEGCKQSN